MVVLSILPLLWFLFIDALCRLMVQRKSLDAKVAPAVCNDMLRTIVCSVQQLFIQISCNSNHAGQKNKQNCPPAAGHDVQTLQRVLMNSHHQFSFFNFYRYVWNARWNDNTTKNRNCLRQQKSCLLATYISIPCFFVAVQSFNDLTWGSSRQTYFL